MKAFISKSEATGRAAAPPSKSYTIRALMCAALADGESLVRNPLKSDDTIAAISVLTRRGVRITEEGGDLRVVGGGLKISPEELFCRESAATLRFMTAISALIAGTTRLTFGPGLARRPMHPLLSALTELGVECRLEGDAIIVEGGKIAGGAVRLGSDISSQYISALLLIAARMEEGLIIDIAAPPRSRPYILMTLECLRHFGVRALPSPDLTRIRVAPQSYQPATYQVEGDWSQASYLLALGALAGEVLVTNLNAESLQGDRVILNLLQKMGTRFSQRGGSVMVSHSPLRAVSANLSDAIDLLPTMAVLAATAVGDSELYGIANARLKESNRVSALCEELGKMGIRIIEEADSLRVIGAQPKGAVIDAHADHRLVMAFAVLGAAVGGVTILGAESVDKTFPDFWRVFRSLGGRVELRD
ncbi:MAG: 3-phosphoshikimate 1-carboxyvinyltransferase [Dehalococcoidia bacterium]|nr:3-phosphoshikimate 1-carboxyvinyltransferase [Dehalococcoidia bacterium]